MVKNALFHMQIFQRGRHGGNGAEHDFDASGVPVRHRRGVAAIATAHTARFLDFMGKIVIRLAGLDLRGNGVVSGQAFQRGQQFIRGDGALRDLTPCAVEPHPGREAGAQAEIGHAAVRGPEQQIVDLRIVPADAGFGGIHVTAHCRFPPFFCRAGATVKAEGAVIRYTF